MSITRTISAVAAGIGFVYILYLSRLEVPLSTSLNPATLALASASIFSSAVVLFYSRRVRTQVQALSESRRWVGWVPFSGGILFYLLGTISSYPDFLHWVSLWILVPSITVLILGIRNSSFSFPLLSLLFLIAPSISNPIAEYESALLLLFSASILVFIILSEFLPKWVRPIAVAPFAFEALIVLVPGYALAGVFVLAAVLGSASVVFLRRAQDETESPCELDASPINTGRRGCVNCGRLFEWRETSHVGSEVLVLSTLAVVALLIGFVSVPLASVTATDVSLVTASPGQMSSAPLIAAPPGFLENYSAASPANRTLYPDYYYITKQFFPVVHPENFSYTVYIEVASSYTYLVKHWQYLGGYNRTTETFNTNGSSPIIVYSTLLKANGTSIIAISYEVPVAVMLNGTHAFMHGVTYVGVNVLAKPSFEVTPQAYEAIKRQMLLYFVVPGAQLIVGGAWTGDLARASSTLASVEPYIPLGAGAALIAGLTSSVLSVDRKDQRLLDAVDGLSYDYRQILATALRLRMDRAPKSGAELFSGLGSTEPSPITSGTFYGRLAYLERLGYFTQTATFTEGRIHLLWRLTTL
ncbi:MAG: hypothetical protein ABSB26_09005 [Nitrososphaerales archaeon]|jgi:hypothetical protein